MLEVHVVDTNGMAHLLWVETRPPKRYVQILSAGPVNVPLFGNRVFAAVSKLT